MLRGSRTALGGLILLGMICVGLSVWMFGPDGLVYRGQFRAGEALKGRVEKFRIEKGRLPTEKELFISEEGPVYYKSCSDSTYIIWFGTVLGESMTYESRAGKWVDIRSGCIDFDLGVP